MAFSFHVKNRFFPQKWPRPYAPECLPAEPPAYRKQAISLP